jgi:hypothetical protein
MKTISLEQAMELCNETGQQLIIPNTKNSKNKKMDLINDVLENNNGIIYDFDEKPNKLVCLEQFIGCLSEIIGIQPTDWAPMILPSFTAGVLNTKTNKMYRENKGKTHVLAYEDECFRLEMSEFNDNTVELLWLKVNDKCKGKGTEVLNAVLDTADTMGINVRVLPVDFEPSPRGNQTTYDYLVWLREWYRSFDFKTYTQLSPALMYTSK